MLLDRQSDLLEQDLQMFAWECPRWLSEFAPKPHDSFRIHPHRKLWQMKYDVLVKQLNGLIEEIENDHQTREVEQLAADIFGGKLNTVTSQEATALRKNAYDLTSLPNKPPSQLSDKGKELVESFNRLVGRR